MEKWEVGMKYSGFRIALIGLLAMLALVGLLQPPASQTAEVKSSPDTTAEMIQQSKS